MRYSMVKRIAATGAVAAMMIGVPACGSSTAGSGDKAAESNGKTEITLWSWDTNQEIVDKFEAKNPDITVKLVNAGTNKDEYTALNNAISAGSGAPDIAQIEYYALPEYAIKGELEDLSAFGAKDYKDFYTPGTWSSVNVSGGVYGLPMDSGPMAFFYNKEVFDKAGVTEVPKTWDEFYAAAKKIRATGSYIVNDAGDAGFYDSMVWQAGGHPFKTSADGKTVTINLTGDEGAKKWTEFWQKMIDEDLIDTKTVGWSDDWNRELGGGSIAAMLTGAWISINLATNSPQATGKWRVAQLPQWTEGAHVNSENGGSSIAMIKSDNDAKKKAAWKYMEFVSHSTEGADYRVGLGAFPSDTKSLAKSEFLDKTTVTANKQEVEYFGGQKYNEELATAAKNVASGYEFLPFEVYARSVFTDTAGKAFSGDGSLSDGVKAWQAKLVDYAKSQGFEVKTK
ncbi:ABC transporter substrate-binding protein [Bifidobacterium goeldii]|uniref:ABC transporter substrate-binding protein n=1 Tax=Bifidobacterium goeldii TaxID=2306975 RepID=A0A430FLE7_9BIFI|nr:sugar ABC transporter substrate-binding protein [Bifidobacterium goeldii]RSX53561.1 ABC transporter substrate-binding protein [Bifidobacterium goeldii]